MAPEQDWCFECGNAATTRVQRPPSWGIPVAVALAALALLAAVVVVAVRALSDDAERAASGGPQPAAATAPARTTTTAAARRPASTTPAAVPATPRTTATVPGAREAAGSGPVPVWPRGKEAYTVVAQTADERPAAERLARRLIAAGTDAGVLRSDGYDFFSDGYWVVWAGQYADRPAAERAAPAVEKRAPGAYVTFIRRQAEG